MEDTSEAKGVFLYTKKIDSEFMVRCLQAMLNNLPDVKFTAILADEKNLGYRVHFSSPNEEVVLAKLQLTVSGQHIMICPLKTYLTVQSTSSSGDVLSTLSDIENAIENRFGKILDIDTIPEFPSHLDSESFRVFSDIPEIKAIEIFQREGSNEMVLTPPNKKLKLKITLCCTKCRNDRHVARDCPQKSLAYLRRASNDSESVPADSTMKTDINLEPTETYAEKIGREEIMKTGYISENLSVKMECIPEAKEIKKEPEYHSSAGVSGENLPSTSHDKEEKYSDDDDNDDVQVITIKDSTDIANTLVKSESKTGAESSDEDNSRVPESPVTPNKKRRSLATPTAVEDMDGLSKPLQAYIDTACEGSGILTRKKLAAFFHHVKKKSNVIEVAAKYTRDAAKLKELLKKISDFYYNSAHVGTKEDKRFIKWLDERIEKFDKVAPQKRKRAG